MIWFGCANSTRQALARRSCQLGLLAGVSLALSGCMSDDPFIATSGPTRDATLTEATVRVADLGGGAKVSYALVPLTPFVISHLHSDDPLRLFSEALTQPRAAEARIGAGDLVGVTVFESGSGGLFNSASGNSVIFPPQQVDRAGDIAIPYAGTIHAAGRTPMQIQRTIEQRLSNRALEPQAVVSVTEHSSNEISVLGENSAAHFSLNPGGERLLSALSRTAGLRYPAYESLVTVSRGNTSESALLSEIATKPSQNIQMQPGDTVYVARAPRYFMALGALGTSTSLSQLDRRIAFGDARISLADALGKSGGVTDDRADAKGIFVYRYEQRDVLADIGVLVTADLPPLVPTIYVSDIRDPGGFFLESQFSMRNGDIVFASNAPAADVTKFLNLLLPISSSAFNINTLR